MSIGFQHNSQSDTSLFGIGPYRFLSGRLFCGLVPQMCLKRASRPVALVLGATRLRGFMLRGYRRSHRLRPSASAVLSSSHLPSIYEPSPKGERYFNSCNLLILVRWLSARTPHRRSAYRAAPGSRRDAHVGTVIERDHSVPPILRQ